MFRGTKIHGITLSISEPFGPVAVKMTWVMVVEIVGNRAVVKLSIYVDPRFCLEFVY